jgi:hypothetical protein
MPSMSDEKPSKQVDRDATGADDLLRCDCGSLLARYVGGQVELKCRRCKRTVLVPIEGVMERDRSD